MIFAQNCQIIDEAWLEARYIARITNIWQLNTIPDDHSQESSGLGPYFATVNFPKMASGVNSQVKTISSENMIHLL